MARARAKYPPDQSVVIQLTDTTTRKVTCFRGWRSFNISSDQTQPSGSFQADYAGTQANRKLLVRGGHKLEVFSHGVKQLYGMTEALNADTSTTSTMHGVQGRSSMALLEASTCALGKLGLLGLTLLEVANQVTDPWQPDWLPGIVTNHAASRYLVAAPQTVRVGGYWDPQAMLRGIVKEVPVRRIVKGAAKKFGKNSPLFAGTTAERIAAVRIRREEKVGALLRRLAAQIGAMVWQAADGWMVIARPCHDFDPSAYGRGIQLFWNPHTNRATGGTVLGARWAPSIADRASEYIVGGASKVNKNSRGKGLQAVGRVRDPGPAFWRRQVTSPYLTNNLMPKPEFLDARSLVSEGALAPSMMNRLARRTMVDRALKGYQLTYLLPGHHCPDTGVSYVFDSTIEVHDERNEIFGPHLITRVEKKFDQQGGRVTQVRVEPKDLRLGRFDDDSLGQDDWDREHMHRIWW